MRRTKPFSEEEFRIYTDFVKGMSIEDDYFELMGGDYRLILCENQEGEAAEYFKASRI